MNDDNLENRMRKMKKDVIERLEFEAKFSKEIPELITGDYTIRSGIYTLSHDIRVENGRLTIEKGTTLNFEKDKGVYIGTDYTWNTSRIMTLGTQQEPIILQAKTATWNGITIARTKEDNSIIYTTIRDAKKKEGGGIYSGYSKLYLKNTTLKNCQAESFGGIYFIFGELQIDNSTIEKCTGGGLLNQDTELNIDKTTIKNNYSGSGIYNASSDVKITNSMITENAHGGISNSSANVKIENTQIIGNTTPECGGAGIHNSFGSVVTIENTRIMNNRIVLSDWTIQVNRKWPNLPKAHGGGVYNDKPEFSHTKRSQFIQIGKGNYIYNNKPDNIYEEND